MESNKKTNKQIQQLSQQNHNTSCLADKNQKNENKIKSLGKFKGDNSILQQKNQQNTFHTSIQFINNKTEVSSINQFDNSIQIEKVNLTLDVGSYQRDLEKKKFSLLTPIVEEISRRFIFDETEIQQKKIQQVIGQKLNQKLNNHFEKNIKDKNSFLIDSLEQDDLSFQGFDLQRQSKINQSIENKFNCQGFLPKLQSIKLDQITLNQLEEEKPQTNVCQFSSILIKQKKILFYFTIRKALQQVVSQYEGIPILFQLNKIQNQKKKEAKYKAAMKEHIHKNKKEFMNNIFYQNVKKKKHFQKLIIVVIDDQNIIDQSEQEFQLLLNNLKNFQ
ncbi:tetratricopeptide repeat protein (macronuclear) [Tetrahymena thermophila SB210]|uniref:Tetratricopeptide repeat protein n=1 Tax=Tetrahymena thermophila (strain SB210) TaxID=312017 RepID=W7XDW6_TETTS|nr:tetratricopeptide repeat protein [Tetrahymena thermophila SB210]EWS72081.1 tetratricopeptide repeat protein [Tetrahymena thermophila SB210]|eukprot:XP_012655392.1 tetratricopeptide repeat protein [Tetrahymena thermophila SB210]